MQQHLPTPDLITPVPSHWKKQWRRGLHPSYFIAKEIGHALSIPVYKAVKQKHYSPDQKQLNKNQRLKNLAHGFVAERSLNGEHVAIVDDVMTTGATANAMAKALKAAGASRVSVWVLARTDK